MPGWLIILIVFIVGGAIFGLFASGSKEDDLSPAQGCLAGALMGGAGGLGCLTIILEAILPFVIAVLVFCWLFDGCS